MTEPHTHYDEPCDFCGAGAGEDCGPNCPTQASEAPKAIGSAQVDAFEEASIDAQIAEAVALGEWELPDGP